MMYQYPTMAFHPCSCHPPMYYPMPCPPPACLSPSLSPSCPPVENSGHCAPVCCNAPKAIRSTKDWTNTEEAADGPPDSIYATVVLGKKDESYYLIATACGFANVIPSGATVLGVKVEPWSHASHTGYIVTHSLMLTKNGGTHTSWSNNRGDDNGLNKWNTTPGVQHSGGGVDDKWGYPSLDRADVISNNFGVVFACENFYHTGTIPNVTASVDSLKITITINNNGAVSDVVSYPTAVVSQES